MKCINARRFDLCIESGKEVRQLKSGDDGWEAGTTIVMKVVFEEPMPLAPGHSCRSCGNEIPLESQQATPAEWLGFFISVLIQMHTDVTLQPRMSSPPSDILHST